jgi:hypothetical protein
MHSGGLTKIKENGHDINHIYIEADQKTAERYFEQLFDRDPHYTTCDCCGEDYSITEYSSLAEATAYERNCRYIKPAKVDPTLGFQDPVYKTAEYKTHYYLEADEHPPEGYVVDGPSYTREYQTVEQYAAKPDVKVLTKKQICKQLNKQGT